MTPLDLAYRLAVDNMAGQAGFTRAYLDRLAQIVASIDTGAVAQLTALLLRARARHALIAFCGNGGKAAVAAEWVNDLGIETASNFRAVSLTDNVAALTSIANDEGYERVFARQVESLLRPDDVLIALSASGESANVLAAIRRARDRNCEIVGLTGEPNSSLGRLVDLEVCAKTGPDECGLSEDAHMAIMHSIVNWLMRLRP